VYGSAKHRPTGFGRWGDLRVVANAHGEVGHSSAWRVSSGRADLTGAFRCAGGRETRFRTRAEDGLRADSGGWAASGLINAPDRQISPITGNGFIHMGFLSGRILR